MQENLDTEREKITFSEAKEIDTLTSKFFSPETNVEYELKFSSWELVRKPVKKYKSEEYEDKVVLELYISEINGKKTQENQQWDIKNIKLRNQFQLYCEKGLITKKVFNVKRTGTGTQTQYTVTALD